MKKRLTVKEIAKLAGVSKGTVSKVLQGKYSLSKDTYRKVMQVVEKFNYRPNPIARGLSTGKTNNIVFVIPETFTYSGEPFYAKILNAFEIAASESDYWVVFASFKLKDSPQDFLYKAFAIGDALVFAGAVPDSLLNALVEEVFSAPILLIDFRFGSIPFVMPDNVRGGRLAADYLLSRECKSFLFLAGEMEHPGIRERWEGFYRRIKEAGKRAKLVVQGGAHTLQVGREIAEKIYKKIENSTGVFCSNDSLALGFLSFILRKGKTPKVVGFDDIEPASHSVPSLTTIRIDLEQIGRVAFRKIKSLINGVAVEVETRTPVDIIVRET